MQKQEESSRYIPFQAVKYAAVKQLLPPKIKTKPPNFSSDMGFILFPLFLLKG